MGRKTGESSGGGAKASFTIRLPKETGAWLYRRVKDEDKTLTALSVEMMDDHRTWWGMAEGVVRLLKEDAAALNLSERDYIRFLIAGRYRELQAKGVGFQKGADEVLLIQQRR